MLGVPEHRLVDAADLLGRQRLAELNIILRGEVDRVVIKNGLLLIVDAQVIGRVPCHPVDECAGTGLR